MQNTDMYVKCACCGADVRIEVLKSVYKKDCGLDQKPEYEYLLKTIDECPKCHYCSQRLDKAITENVKKIVASKKYQNIMNLQSDDERGRRIRAAAKLAENDAEKANLYLLAAWHYEWEKELKTALQMREKAIVHMEELLKGQVPVATVLIYIDCLRQVGKFAEANEVINEIETAIEENLERNSVEYKIFQYEKELINHLDDAAHMVSEVG